MNVRVVDLTDSAREAVVSPDTVAPLVAGWLTADCGSLVGPSKNVLDLVSALRDGNWRRVHQLADHLSLSVEVV